MDEYKKVIKSRNTRNVLLNFLFPIPTKWMLKIQYKIKLKRWPNLKEPSRFTEKLQVYKMKYKNPLMRKCVDKWEVRKYIQAKGLSDILIESHGVYDDYDDIDLDSLPDSFVIKSTSGGGGNNVLIYQDKKDFDLNDVKKTIGKLGKKIIERSGGREWAYYGLKNRVIIESYLENKENKKGGVDDIKFFCFNGEPKYLVVDTNRFIEHKRSFYDIDWNYLEVKSDQAIADIIKKPKNFDKMIEITKQLSKDFPFVRVDLYNLDGKIYFGELTFYPWSGYVQFDPDDFDITLGKHFDKFSK